MAPRAEERSWPRRDRSKSETFMYKSLFSVGGFTLLSRGAGFLRDVLLGAILGAGLLADAFVVAQRLPNHFRTIFGEGALNSAYVPDLFALCCTSEGLAGARQFSGQIFIGLLVSQILLLALAFAFTPDSHRPSGAGFSRGSAKIRAHRDADADHLSLSFVHYAGDAAVWRLERAWPFRRRGLRPGHDECLDDRLPCRRFSVSQCRLGGELGAYRVGRAATCVDLGGRPSRRNFRALRAPGDDETRQALPCDAWAGGDRFGRHTDRAVRRHDHRLDAADRRCVLDLLRRPHLSVAARRHRHRRGHRAAAGDEPALRGGRSGRARCMRKIEPWRCRSR